MKPISKLDALRARYPLVEITEKDGHLRISSSQCSTTGASVTDEDLEERLYFYNLKFAVLNYLQALYPYLYFSVGDIPGQSDPRHPVAETFKNYKPSKSVVWLRRIYDYGSRSLGVACVEGTATGFEFSYPPDEEATKKLTELNTEAEHAQQEGYFFCTGCQKAKVKEEYAGYHFASVLCKSCATPEWLKRAREETYD